MIIDLVFAQALLLQWGRTREGARRQCRSLWRGASGCCFSGAAPVKVRKDQVPVMAPA